MKKIISLGFVLGIFPVVAFAAENATVISILKTISAILAILMPILIALAAIYFVWGILTFIMAKEEEQKKAGRSKIINGLIGLFVIVAFWGIIGVVMRTFGVYNQLPQDVVPQVPVVQ